MVKDILELNGVLYTSVVICGICMIFKLLLLVRYKQLISAAEAIGSNKTKRRRNKGYARSFIKEITGGFEMEYRNSYYVSNVNIFVNKYLYGISMMKIRYSTWETMGLLSVLVCLTAGMAGAFGAYYYDMGQDAIVRYIMEGLIASGIIVIADAFIDIPNRKEQLRINICNYLENFMKPRLERGDYSYKLAECARLSDEVDAGMMALIESLNDSGREHAEPDESDNIITAEVYGGADIDGFTQAQADADSHLHKMKEYAGTANSSSEYEEYAGTANGGSEYEENTGTANGSLEYEENAGSTYTEPEFDEHIAATSDISGSIIEDVIREYLV